jgi:regulatory protein
MSGSPITASGRRRRGPRKATEKSLKNAAFFYLARFDASAEKVRRVLLGRAGRSARAHGTDAKEGRRIAESVIAKLLGLGLLDDRAYGERRAAALHRRGTPIRVIARRLASDGVAADDIDAALASLAGNAADLDLAAAVAYARRRRLGPYRIRLADPGVRAKELAAFSRAGFGYAVALRVVDTASAEALDRVAADLDEERKMG